jgi:hypothetical protein
MVFDREIPNGVKPLRGLLRSLPGPGLALEVPCQDDPFSWLAGQDGPAMHRVTHGITMGIRAAGEFEDYWSARPKELRDNVRRHARRVDDEGLEPRLERIDDASRIGRAVDRYGELESQGWKGQDGTALHPTNQQGRFYRALLEAFASTGRGRVYELFFGDRLVASRLVISGPSMHVILKTTHDEKLRRYVPGHLQLQGVLRDLLSRPDRLPVELYTKADRDWLLWSTHSRNIDDVSIYRNALVARVASWRRRFRLDRTKSPLAR